MSEMLLNVKDLNVIYKTDLETVYAVNGISFSMKKGETLGIVGETGAGKTTTAKAILRVLPESTGIITGGSIEFMGHNLTEMPEIKIRSVRGKNISMIFQDPMTSLNPVITIRNQIGEALALHNEAGCSKEEIETRIDEVLSMVGITPERKYDYPHQFSGGMKQRVVIAMALACEPELLIADEPTTALDVTIQAQVLRMMRELRERLGTSMIMITHDLGIIAQTCDNVAVMYAGEIIEQGTLKDIFKGEQHHPYTVGLFGSIPNIKEKSERLNPITGMMPDPTNLPIGCKFSPRCSYCMDRCLDVKPKVYENYTHKILCHLFSKEGK